MEGIRWAPSEIWSRTQHKEIPSVHELMDGSSIDGPHFMGGKMEKKKNRVTPKTYNKITSFPSQQIELRGRTFFFESICFFAFENHQSLNQRNLRICEWYIILFIFLNMLWLSLIPNFCCSNLHLSGEHVTRNRLTLQVVDFCSLQPWRLHVTDPAYPLTCSNPFVALAFLNFPKQYKL
jgi:hypothetical protein